MDAQNAIIFRGKTLRLVRLQDGESNDTCFRCALEMYNCNSLCMRFGGMLGYTRAASERMYFVEE